MIFVIEFALRVSNTAKLCIITPNRSGNVCFLFDFKFILPLYDLNQELVDNPLLGY
jgi:hypothetical protein